MRYMLITYVKKPNNQIDEQVELSNVLRERDITTCNVIIDFKEKVVDKGHISGNPIPKDFDKIVEYYKKIYPDLIQDLENSNI